MKCFTAIQNHSCKEFRVTKMQLLRCKDRYKGKETKNSSKKKKTTLVFHFLEYCEKVNWTIFPLNKKLSAGKKIFLKKST